MADTLELNVSPDLLRKLYGEISVLDEKIASASGSDSAGKRAIANALATEHSESWTNVAESVVNHVADYTTEQKVALLTGVTKALRDALGEETDKYLTEEAEKNKKDAPEVSDDELNAVLAERKEKVDQFKSVKNILEMFGQDVSDIPDPKRMTGSRGPRGPRTLGKFNWFVNGEPRSKTQNSLSSIANTLCAPLGWKTKELREFIVSQGVNTDEPPDTFEVTLPEIEGKTYVVSAVKDDTKEEDKDDDDNDDTQEPTPEDED